MAHARTGEAEAKTAGFLLGPETVYGNGSKNNMPLFLRQQFFGNNTMAAVRKLHVVRYEANNDNAINLSHI